MSAYRDGTTHVVLEPLDFMARFHGVFAPHHRLRPQIVAARQRAAQERVGQGIGCQAGMCWAQRLKRVFGIDIEKCEHCGAQVKIIASIEDPQVIGKILSHLGLTSDNQPPASARAPPRTDLLFE